MGEGALAELEHALRVALGALGVFVALLALSAMRARAAARVLAALAALATAAYAACSSAGFGAMLTAGGIAVPIVFLCAALPAIFWAFANSWFDDEFAAWRLAAGFIAGFGMLGLATSDLLGLSGVRAPALFAVRNLLAIGLVAHALARIWRGARTDLVGERLGVRHTLVWVAGVYILGVLATEIWLSGDSPPAIVHVANLSAIWIVSAAVAIGLLRWDLRPPEEAREDVVLQVPAEAPTPAAAPVATQEARLLDMLERAMREERLYRKDGLSIAALAAKLGTQEHRLRRAINRGLGYRNFNEFLHHYRLAEVAARLHRAEDAQLPILTLALESGYGSIGPFNRAFKARYGVTPTEYREMRTANP